MKRIPCVFIIIIEVLFKIEEEEGWVGVINCFTIDTKNKAEINITHLIPFILSPILPILTTCHSLPVLALSLLLALPTS